MSHRISTPNRLSRGRWDSSAANVPSGVYCRTFTSYITAERDHAGWNEDGSALALLVAAGADAVVAAESASCVCGSLEHAKMARAAVTGGKAVRIERSGSVAFGAVIPSRGAARRPGAH